MNKPILKVTDLSVGFHQDGKDFYAVNDVSFELNKGEVLGIVGESGSGKSLTALSILGLLPYPKAFHDKKSSIKFNEIELINNPKLSRFRGNRLGFIFQEPMSSLNPLHTVGHQIAETLILHQGLTAKKARREVLRLLPLTGIKNARERLKAYPHQLSGGQRQRVMIAMAIANRPDILIADEPTTALDVTVQSQIIDLLIKLKNQLQMSIIFISHDLHLIRKIADRTIVMKSGRIIEQGLTEKIFLSPQKEYTKTLINSINTLKQSNNISRKNILEVKNLNVEFPLKKNFWGITTQTIKAVDNVSLTLKQGETLGIVGESGSGKTTLGQAICRLTKSAGQILFDNRDLNTLSNKQLRPLRSRMQIIFQDPYNSLNPRMTVEQIIAEGLIAKNDKLHKNQIINKTIKEIGLTEKDLSKYPHEFSGGQRQRIAIARALVMEPQLLILDEPTSALDVTIQAQIIKLLQDIQKSRGLSYIFISHDMRAVKAVSDRIAVMKDGKIVELGTRSEIFEHPRQLYTQNLIQASL